MTNVTFGIEPVLCRTFGAQSLNETSTPLRAWLLTVGPSGLGKIALIAALRLAAAAGLSENESSQTNSWRYVVLISRQHEREGVAAGGPAVVGIGDG